MTRVRVPDAPVLADETARIASAYVHVPFCARRCPYCDFAVVVDGEPGYDAGPAAYVAAVIAEIDMEAPWRPLAAVAVGGGTPTQVDPAHLGRIVDALARRFGFTPGAEVALEANPEDWDVATAEQLLDAGFDRVSFGVQSFDETTLTRLGRRHTPEQAVAGVETARAAGFRSVGVDLIYGTPGESLERWGRSVDQALELNVDHLSAYALTVERGTALSRAIAAGAPAPDPDVQAEAYELLVEQVARSDLVRYEVSNWARPGHHSRYNLATWGGGEYVAFGAGAHDHRAGRRGRNVRRVDAYLAQVTAGCRPRAGVEHLDAAAMELDRVLLGLRRAAGVDPGVLGGRFLTTPQAGRLLDAGVIAVRDGRLVVERPLLTDAAARAVYSVSTADC